MDLNSRARTCCYLHVVRPDKTSNKIKRHRHNIHRDNPEILERHRDDAYNSTGDDKNNTLIIVLR